MRTVYLSARSNDVSFNSSDVSNQEFPVCLAPMVGLSHFALRSVVRRYTPQAARTIWPTEMLNSRRLPNENLETTPETMKVQSDSDIVPQILGNEESYITKSVERLEDWGAIGIDINMGCPVKKALRHNYGVVLMGDIDYAARVVDMTVRNTKLPVSVKLRAGEQDQPEKLIALVKKLQDAGASWLTLHPRFANQMRRGLADWNKIGEVRAALQIPVIGNGDIQTCDDVFQMMNVAGVKRVMVGRALTARPWLMWQVSERLGSYATPEGFSGKAPQSAEEEGAEYGRALLHFIDVIEPRLSLDLALRKTRFFVKTGSVWLEFGHILNAKISGCESFAQMRQVILEFFAQPQRMMKHTALRQ